MTRGTDWMRLTSSWARSSSRLRFFVSSLMYSSCAVTRRVMFRVCVSEHASVCVFLISLMTPTFWQACYLPPHPLGEKAENIVFVFPKPGCPILPTLHLVQRQKKVKSLIATLALKIMHDNPDILSPFLAAHSPSYARCASTKPGKPSQESNPRPTFVALYPLPRAFQSRVPAET